MSDTTGPSDGSDPADRERRSRRVRLAIIVVVAALLVGGWWWHTKSQHDAADAAVGRAMAVAERAAPAIDRHALWDRYRTFLAQPEPDIAELGLPSLPAAHVVHEDIHPTTATLVWAVSSSGVRRCFTLSLEPTTATVARTPCPA